jgi:carboxypeptidase family protein
VTLIAAIILTGSIRGTVVDTRGGTGVRDVSVRLQSTGRTVSTDESGRFELTDVPAGAQELYVSAVDFLLVKRAVTVVGGETVEVTIALTEGTGTYAETVDVRASAPQTTRQDEPVPAEQTLAGVELQQLRGVLTNDPLRAVQLMPAVAAGDDFRSEFAIRGADVNHTVFTFEGISTPFLLHTVRQVHDTGSVAMVNGDVLDEITVANGSYPQRFGDRTGAEIDFRMREGARDGAHAHVSVSAIDASAVVEGPIGAAKRGSWLASVRKSYLDLIVDRLYPEQNVSFGFADAQAKAVYDVTPRHQVQVAITAGRSRLERDPSLLNPGNLRDGDNESVLGVVTWRYLPSASFRVTQRFAADVNRFDNTSRDGADLDSGDARETIYRVDLAKTISTRTTLEAGGEARWTTGIGREQRLSGSAFVLRESFNASATTDSAYGQLRLGPITSGVRVDHHSLTSETYASPWAQALVPLSARLALRAGGGIYRQAPDFFEVLGTRGTPSLQSERAYDLDAGVEGRVGGTARWQATLYDREDRDWLQLPFSEMRIVNGRFVNASTTSRYVNALDGYSRGVELLLQRQTPNGLSGWISYALGFNRDRSRATGETFWGDDDQRHTVNVYGNYRVSDRMSFSARFRAGSNFPITGYWDAHDDAYFVGTERNTVRVPYYSRLDVRMNRTFTWSQKRLTLYLEGINVYNRSNVRFGTPIVDRQTFLATRMFETMVPLIPSVGVLLEF